MNLSLGHRLKASRDSRGLSLADAAHETRIPVQRLRHLEEDNYAAFGSMTYARSFLKLYSDFLGVDASEILEDLPPAVMGGAQDYRYLTDSFGPWLRERTVRPNRLTEQPAGRLQSIKSPLPTAIALFVCVLAATGMFGKYVADSQRSLSEQQSVRETVPNTQAKPLSTAAEPFVGPPEEVIQKAVPVDRITLAPQQRTYPVLQPGAGQ